VYPIVLSEDFKEDAAIPDYQLEVTDSGKSINVEITVTENTVVGFELFSYITLPGFQNVPQLIFHQSSVPIISSKNSFTGDFRYEITEIT
jgi:hypothetical protein